MHRELPCGSPSLVVGMLGLVFFEETVKNERHLSMLCNTSVPHLLATGLPLYTQSVVHAGWNQAAHSECCFELSA
jgi:hypothetical protein